MCGADPAGGGQLTTRDGGLTLSRRDERWLIDAVLVQPAGEAATVERAPSPPPKKKKKSVEEPWLSPQRKTEGEGTSGPAESISCRRRDVLWRINKSALGRRDRLSSIADHRRGPSRTTAPASP